MAASYDNRIKRYRSARGAVIAPHRVSEEIERTVARAENRLRLLGRRLTQGKLTLPEWQIASREEIKLLHIATHAVGKGGWQNMTLADWGRVGADIRTQYAYHNRFARDIEAGRAALGQLEFRAGLYAKPARNGFHNNRLREEVAIGAKECRRILNASESCSACTFWAAKGWIPVTEQPEIGSLVCKAFCKCTVEYRTAP